MGIFTVFVLIFRKLFKILFSLGQSAGAVKIPGCISTEGNTSLPLLSECPDMRLNNL